MTEELSTREDALAWLRLTLVPGVAPTVQQALLRAYGTPGGVFAAARGDLASRAGQAVTEALAAGPSPKLLEKTLRWLEAPDHHLVTLADAAYPKALLDITDPPTVIYAKGRIELLNMPCLAIVGSRNATPQGKRDAQAFAHALSRSGLCIVSGMALGIDAAAHRGGLAAAGSSIAVLGTGVDIVYPAPNRDLAHALAAHGCLASEFPLGTPSIAGNFPRRNRLISGLSRGVLVVEAGIPSGSLNTARHAIDQGRDVFAIPGSIHSPLSKGCHDLLKQGAKLVEEAADILAEIGWITGDGAEPSGSPRQPSHPLLEAMGFAPASLDQIVERTGLAANEIAAQLSRFEIEGRIAPLPGGWFQRVER